MLSVFHRRNTLNVGDLHGAPSLYFPLNGQAHDLADWQGRIRGAVIVGGGGLLHSFFDAGVQRLLDQKPKRIIIWGIGVHGSPADPLTLPGWLSDCELVGLRDWGTPFDWVPCASCMSPLFDDPPDPVHRVVVYKHHDFRTLPDLPFPTMHNCTRQMQDAVDFLASGEVVVTNSYHGAYWATLLGRRVLAYPFSNKFRFMRHPPVLLAKGDDPLPHVHDGASYPNALRQCRAANVAFYERVRRLLT